jgi:tetratricopeptide (TPR) repeat protein
MRKIRGLAVFVFLITGYSLLITRYALSADIEKVDKLFLEGRYERAITEADILIDARSYGRDQLYYIKGLSQLKLERFEGARESFDAIITKLPSSKLVFDAYLSKADSYHLEGRNAEAIRAYNEIIQIFPDDKNLAVVYKRLGKDKAISVAIPEVKPEPKPEAKPSVKKEGKPVRAISNFTPKDCVKKEVVKEEAAVYGEEKKTLPPAEYEKVFSVQVGSFSSKRNAERLNTKLIKAGYDSRVELTGASGDNLYRVKIGRFATKAEAEGMASKLKRDGYSTRICAK